MPNLDSFSPPPPSFEDNSLRQSGYAKSGQKKFPNARNVTTLQGSVALPGWLAQCSPTTSWTLCKELTELRSRNPSSALLLLKEDSVLSCLSGMNSANPIFHLTWVERTTFFFFFPLQDAMLICAKDILTSCQPYAQRALSISAPRSCSAESCSTSPPAATQGFNHEPCCWLTHATRRLTLKSLLFASDVLKEKWEGKKMERKVSKKL